MFQGFGQERQRSAKRTKSSKRIGADHIAVNLREIAKKAKMVLREGMLNSAPQNLKQCHH